MTPHDAREELRRAGLLWRPLRAGPCRRLCASQAGTWVSSFVPFPLWQRPCRRRAQLVPPSHARLHARAAYSRKASLLPPHPQCKLEDRGGFLQNLASALVMGVEISVFRTYFSESSVPRSLRATTGCGRGAAFSYLLSVVAPLRGFLCIMGPKNLTRRRSEKKERKSGAGEWGL